LDDVTHKERLASCRGEGRGGEGRGGEVRREVRNKERKRERESERVRESQRVSRGDDRTLKTKKGRHMSRKIVREVSLPAAPVIKRFSPHSALDAAILCSFDSSPTSIRFSTAPAVAATRCSCATHP
jgi:hypothetical protein